MRVLPSLSEGVPHGNVCGGPTAGWWKMSKQLETLQGKIRVLVPALVGGRKERWGGVGDGGRRWILGASAAIKAQHLV